MGVGGDGFDVAHDGQNPLAVYGRSNSTIVASATDGNSYSGITPPWSASELTYLAAVATDPNTNGVVYASSKQNLYQSTSGGSPWAKRLRSPGPPMK